jgi:6-pyruvoyltetrahydropterin/6-carboxytetrahydropterin synthase
MPTLTFSRRYAMAHRLLSDPQSKCATPHGHDQVVSVRLRPTRGLDVGGSNMAAPFDRVKRRWHGWIDGQVDHALHLNLTDPLLDYFRANEPAQAGRIMTFRGDPTTEALVVAFWRKLEAFIAADDLPFVLEALTVQETPTNAVSLDAEGAARVGAWSPGDWCDRADESLNDLAPVPVMA